MYIPFPAETPMRWASSKARTLRHISQSPFQEIEKAMQQKAEGFKEKGSEIYL